MASVYMYTHTHTHTHTQKSDVCKFCGLHILFNSHTHAFSHTPHTYTVHIYSHTHTHTHTNTHTHTHTILIKSFSAYMIIMYVIIGTQNCIQCDELKNLLDEKGKPYYYLDMTEMPNKTMTYLRMYCISFPIVLNINHSFSDFDETFSHFNHI
jgi:glutaredoxin